MSAYFAAHALLPDGWASDVRFEIDPSGNFASVRAGSRATGATPLHGLVLPGMPNVHSHAFQRVVAGRTEYGRGAGDSFWTWRDAMYERLETLDPDDFERLATQAYAAMLETGYTTVCEFHYVHHAPNGRRYANPLELAERIVAAARATGIALTLLPVLYRHSDFGGRAPLARQARFVQTFDEFATNWHALRAAYVRDPQITLGLAPHSLRAVAPDDLRRLVALADRSSGDAVPMHVHVSEQLREVDACRAAHGTTPIELLGDAVELGRRWCLIHATHATPAELTAVARAGAVVGLCPTTEANLGDGIFPVSAFVKSGGRIAIGSDSNVSIDVAEELRWLEYVARLVARERSVLRDDATPSVARYLYTEAARSGAQAAGRGTGELAAGRRADFVALASLGDVDPETALAMHVFRSGSWRIAEAFAGGAPVVREGRHVPPGERKVSGA